MTKFNFNSLVTGKRTRIDKIQPAGSLWARKQADGAILFYWLYNADGKNGWALVGQYDSSAPPRSIEPTERGTYSLNAAIRKAETLASEHKASLANQGGGHVEITQKRITERKQREQAAFEKQNQTFEKLFLLYADTLTNKKTRDDALGTYRKHLETQHPKLLKTTVSDIDAYAWADIFRGIATEAPRSADKLRSFVMAAYNKAYNAPFDPSIPLEFKQFKIEINPVARTKPAKGTGNADKDPFSLADMRIYWQLIKDVEGIKGAALRIHLLTGGLRPLQLIRLRAEHISDNYFTLYDLKGTRDQPQPYSTPTSSRVKKDLDILKQHNIGGYLFSTTHGQTVIWQKTLLKWAQQIVGQKIERFTLKRVRSGVETFLSSRGISQEIRGRLQSHGVSGIQNKHYNAYDYLKEKTHALRILEDAITQQDKTVIKLIA
ncbi:integrase [Formosimonas limnophila]|uniref:integrase n=1 Tax=Formosimonas limnophila TaxID=1384487 RepID=UPI001672E8E5|nr:integrase [Formosimonas limnophila]